jgi:beta-N-acetylhexosaminidase
MTNGATILAPAGLRLTDLEKVFFRGADPWGFILFARNVDTPDQLRLLTAELREAVGRDAPIMMDQEGGRVQRMRAPHWAEYLPPLEQADRAQDAARSFWLRGRLIAAELRDVGIDTNCGPTCDIASDETHPFLQNRCMGRNPQTVIENARATADGYLAGGVLPIIKHMPGHGRTTVDSHLNLPTANAELLEASGWDFAPFRALNHLPMGMSAHMVFREAGDLPATQNPALIEMIRIAIGFDGLLMTDDISMEALSGSIGERAAVSIAAGCDVALHCNGDLTEMVAVVAAAGQMTDAAQRRADHALTFRKDPDNIDISALKADLAAELG